jgi:hypothetical protein
MVLNRNPPAYLGYGVYSSLTPSSAPSSRRLRFCGIEETGSFGRNGKRVRPISHDTHVLMLINFIAVYANAKAEAVVFVPLFWGEPIIVSASVDLYTGIHAFNAPFRKAKMATKAVE